MGGGGGGRCCGGGRCSGLRRRIGLLALRGVRRLCRESLGERMYLIIAVLELGEAICHCW